MCCSWSLLCSWMVPNICNRFRFTWYVALGKSIRNWIAWGPLGNHLKMAVFWLPVPCLLSLFHRCPFFTGYTSICSLNECCYCLQSWFIDYGKVCAQPAEGTSKPFTWTIPKRISLECQRLERTRKALNIEHDKYAFLSRREPKLSYFFNDQACSTYEIDWQDDVQNEYG